jgi:MFS family permease
LNGTERDYALVSVSFGLFETALFPLPMLMMDSLPFTLLMLLTFSLFTVAGVVYGCATHIWIVFVARGLMGAAALFASSIIYTYIGEIGSIMDMERLKMRKKPMKGTLYLAITFTTHGSHIVLLGINAGLVRIPSVNPYRLPGWFLTALGVTAAIIVLLFFSETRPWTCRFKSSCDIKSGWSDFQKMRSKSKSYLKVSKS